MKVNFVVDYPKIRDNGITTAALRLAERLESKGIDVSINGKGYNYDILHSHATSPKYIFKIKKAKRLGLKTVIHAHTTAEDIRGSFILTKNDFTLDIIGKYLTYFYNNADIVITPSNWSKSTLIKRGVNVPIKVLSNGIDLKEFNFDERKSRAFKDKYGIDYDDILVYTIGIVFIRKGIETFKKVAEELKHLKFLWAGKRYKPLFIDYTSVNKILKNLPPNLNFLGRIDNEDLVGIHCAGDIFLFPSFAENQAIATLEARACSKAIVLRNLPVYDWAIHKENCLIAQNDEEFIRYVNILSKDKNLRYKIGRAAKKVAKKNDINITIKELIKNYEDLLSS